MILFYFLILCFKSAFIRVFLLFPQRDTSPSPQFSDEPCHSITLSLNLGDNRANLTKPLQEMNTHSFIRESHWALLNL